MVALDFPIDKIQEKEKQEIEFRYKLGFNADWAIKTAELRKKYCPDIRLLLPVQCYTTEHLEIFLRLIGDIPFDGFSMPVRNLSTTEIALFLVRFYQLGIKQVHLLGVSSFFVIALAAYMAGHFFDWLSLDATSWRLAAQFSQYMNPHDLLSESLDDSALIDERIQMDCQCPWCQGKTFTYVKNLPFTEKSAFLRSHNHWVIERAAREIYDNSTSLAALESHLKRRSRKPEEVEKLCRCLAIAETFKDSPMDQWKGLLATGPLNTTKRTGGRTTEAKRPIKSGKPVSGTKEWTGINENCLIGCSNGCKYCYALENSARFKRKMPIDRMKETLRPRALTRKFKKQNRSIMFPTTHDISPIYLKECMDFLEHMLIPGNKVLVVSKPRLDCIKAICERFTPFKDQILFRFTIGSTDSGTLKFWEPNAPDFQERLESLQYAFQQGYKTSVSCESMLDSNMDDLISQTTPFITDAIWLGKMNRLLYRLELNGEDDPITIAKAQELNQMQSDEFIWDLYLRYKDNPKVKWKESIKKVVGLEIATEPGLDK